MDYATIEDFLRQLKPVNSYQGIVEDILDDEVLIGFRDPISQKRFIKKFPRERLASVKMPDGSGADFVLAEVQYDIYSLGPYNITVLRYVGKSTEELLTESESSIREEDVAVLDELAGK